MNVLRWIDDQLEETFMVIFLAIITCVIMMQIFARTFYHSLTWPEEFSRYCYIWTVFFSLGYTIRKGNALRVGILMDMLPNKLRKVIEIITNVIMLVLYFILFRYSIIYTAKIKVTGQVSPAMRLPMWIMYMSTVIGFGLAVFRMIQEIYSNFKNFNKEAKTTLESTIKEAEEEVMATGTAIPNKIEVVGGDF